MDMLLLILNSLHFEFDNVRSCRLEFKDIGYQDPQQSELFFIYYYYKHIEIWARLDVSSLVSEVGGFGRIQWERNKCIQKNSCV